MKRALQLALMRVRCIAWPRIARSEATARARAELERRGYGVGVPMRVQWGPICYTVVLDRGFFPEPFVKIDRLNGEVRHVGMPVR